MAHRVKIFATKYDNLSLTLRIHMVKGETPASCPLTSVRTLWHAHSYSCTHTNNKNIIKI